MSSTHPPRTHSAPPFGATSSALPAPTRRRSRIGPALLTLAVSLVACGDAAKTPPPQAPQVLVAPVQQKDVQLEGEWVGTTDGMVTATIRPKISGYLLSQDYTDGALVQKGELLFRIDPRQYKASLDAAKGELAAARAVLGKAELDVDRYTPLAERGAVSQEELDDAIQARAAGRARVVSAQAEVEQAEINLDWTEIHSPITGIAGIAPAQIGDLVNPVITLTTVSQLQPIKVTFPISEIEYLLYSREQKERTARGEARIGRPLTLILADGTVYEHEGKIIVTGREVSATTGTILIQGVFDNPGNLMRPGQYAKIRAATHLLPGALVIPQRAVSQLQGIDQVWVVDEAGKAKQRTVTLGPRFEQEWVIEDGMKAGERVVVEGLQKLRDGMMVDAKLAPDPAASSGSTTNAAAKPSGKAAPANAPAGS